MLKYIKFIDTKQEKFIVTFPNHINHSDMAETMLRLRYSTFSDWERAIPSPVSAGFVNAKNECYGKSESLGIASEPEDTELLNSQYLK